MATCATQTCSTCLLATGFAKDCGNKPVGGNKTIIYIIPRCHIYTYNHEVALDSDSSIGSITLVTPVANRWFTIEANKDTVTTTEDLTLPNGFITQTVVLTIPNYATSTEATPDISDSAQAANDFLTAVLYQAESFVLAIQDRNGVYRLFGYQNGLDLTALQKVSGAAITDLSGSTLTFSGGEPRVSSIIDPGSDGSAVTCDTFFDVSGS